MEINRKQLLSELKTVEGGVASKETVAQSKCFVFQNGEVMTYNNEIACRTKSSLDITAAIDADKMLNMVSKWPEDVIEFKKIKGRLQFKGKAKRGYFKTEDKIALPIADVDTPKKWKALSQEIIDALKLVSGCASTKSEAPHLACIHFTNKWVEATDGIQAGRCLVKTPFKSSTLLNHRSIAQVISLEMNEISASKNWVHFKNADGLVISCHKYPNPEDFISDKLTGIFKAKGSPGVLPKGIKELVDRLKIFIDDDVTPWLKVKVTPEYIEVKGEGKYGSQTERKKVKYSGKPIGFSINPQLFSDLADKYNKCEISDKVIKVEKDNFQYVTSLWIPNEKEDE